MLRDIEQDKQRKLSGIVDDELLDETGQETVRALIKRVYRENKAKVRFGISVLSVPFSDGALFHIPNPPFSPFIHRRRRPRRPTSKRRLNAMPPAISCLTQWCRALSRVPTAFCLTFKGALHGNGKRTACVAGEQEGFIACSTEQAALDLS